MSDGDTVKSLYVGRTLPYEESRNGYWNPKDSTYVENDLNSFVKDAVVTISVDGQTYPLHYFKSGYYKNDSLVGTTGKTYRLHVEWKDKIANAVTTVPELPILDSVSVSYKEIAVYEYNNESEYICSGFARANVNDVLSLTVEKEATITGSYPAPYTYTSKYGFGQAVSKRTQPNHTIVDVLTRKFRFSESSSSQSTNPRIVFTLRSYDEPYYKYYMTFFGGNSEDDFSIEPRPVAWNVSGDAIGMFIGASKSVTKIYKLN